MSIEQQDVQQAVQAVVDPATGQACWSWRS
jgi:hypothetical protein